LGCSTQSTRIPGWRPTLLDPGRTAILHFFEGIGGRLQTRGVPETARFDAWSAPVNYILGVAGQNAANARNRTPNPIALRSWQPLRHAGRNSIRRCP
jgi:hypothetical protein